MKAVICLGKQTNLLVNSLSNKIPDVEFIPCTFLTGLKEVLENNQDITNFILNEKSLNGKIKSISPDRNYLFILGKDSKIEDYVDNASDYSNIKVVTIAGRWGANTLKEPIQEFLQEIESRNISVKVSEPNSPIDCVQEESPVSLPDIKEEPAVNTEPITEDKPVITSNLDITKLEHIERRFLECDKLDINYHAQKRNLSDKEKDVLLDNKLDVETKIKHVIDYYQNSIISFVGMPKSYTTTTVYNIGKYLAKLGISTCIIDLDSMGYNFSTLNSKLYKDFQNEENNGLQTALKENNIINNCILHESNLHILSAFINQNSIDFNKEVDNLVKLLNKYQHSYKVILFDIKIKDIQILGNLLLNSNEIVFQIPNSNKDYLDFMRAIELIEDKKLREKIFDHDTSNYISVGPDGKRLKTDKNGIAAIDEYMERDLSISNETKYDTMKFIGNVKYNEEANDYLEENVEMPVKDIQNYILNILGV